MGRKPRCWDPNLGPINFSVVVAPLAPGICIKYQTCTCCCSLELERQGKGKDNEVQEKKGQGKQPLSEIRLRSWVCFYRATAYNATHDTVRPFLS